MKQSILKYLEKSVKTELIKKKGSGIFVLSILTGAFIPVIFFIVGQFEVFLSKSDAPGIPKNYFWEWISMSVPSFAGFFFPLLIIIIASKIAQIDHKNRGWNLMETQPVPKYALFFSKFFVLLAANLIAIFSFFFFSLLLAYINSLINTPESDKILSIPFTSMAALGFRIFAASLAITSLQYVLSVKISKFIWPILIGFFGLLLPSFLFSFNIDLIWYPYKLMGNVTAFPDGSDFGYWITYNEVLSFIYSLFILYVGYNWYRFKEFFRAFFSPAKRLVVLSGIVLLFGVAVFFTLKPGHQKPYERTVIAGVVESDQPINKIFLLDDIVNDTLAVIPVKNGTFHLQYQKEIPTHFYQILFGRYSAKSIFFGQNDSLFIRYRRIGEEEDISIKGNRIAEHIQEDFMTQTGRIPYYLDKNFKIDDPDFFMKEIYESWKESLFRLKARRSVDNLEPREDYLNLQKKIISVTYLDFWKSFIKKHQALFPDQSYQKSQGMDELENSVSLTDETLLSNRAYYNLISETLISDDRREIDENTKLLDAISKLDKGSFKDKLLYIQLIKIMETAETILERKTVLNAFIGQIETETYKKLLRIKLHNLNRLSKGEPAPLFKMYAIDGTEYTPTDFKGKFIVFDVWASWCGPCKVETPYFERLALKSKDKPVYFISLNVDLNEKNWIVAIKNKGKSMLQLRVKDFDVFVKDYAIETIPRFILIGPEGNIIDADFSRPSDDSFMERLNSYIEAYKPN